MTVLVARTRQFLNTTSRTIPDRPGRWWLPMLLISLAVLPGEIGRVTRSSLADAYLQVSVFVSLTLLIFYGLEQGLKLDLSRLLYRHRHWQVPVASVLGMLPGCGGSIMVITAYARGQVSFGSIVATLTATMGDAAFVLIAQKPLIAAITIGLSFVIGLATGYLIDGLHGRDFMRQPVGTIRDLGAPSSRSILHGLDIVWLMLSLPGMLMGILLLAHIDADALLDIEGLTAAIGVTGSLLAALIFAMTADQKDMPATSDGRQPMLARVAQDTAFVSVWVIAAYLGYAYLMQWTGWDIGAMFATWAPVLPLLGMLIGLIPGCGPQVIVTSLYVNGAIPYSALISNAISNDGDALFPALAITPKAALLATIYSAVPAVIVGYAAFALGY